MGWDASASLMIGFDGMITRSELTLTKICMLIRVELVWWCVCVRVTVRMRCEKEAKDVSELYQ